jgi:hypothetical protein
MRLPAALWLSDDYVYLDVPGRGKGSGQDVAETPAEIMEEAVDPLLELDPRTSKRATATVTPLQRPIRISLS